MRHFFTVDNIMVNPKLRAMFDSTPNEKRSEKEIEKFWGKPYVLIEEFRAESWEEHFYRLNEDDFFTKDKIGTKEEYIKRIENEKNIWLKNFPSGFRYTVRCLDGGAWDRSSWKGTFGDFDEALTFAKEIYKEYNE